MPVKHFKKLFLILFALCIFLHLGINTAEADQGIITLNYPPDNTVMEFNLASVSLNIPAGTADCIRVSVNDVVKIDVTPERPTVCFTIPLNLGVNLININALKGDQPVDSIAFSIFRRSDLEGKFQNPLKGYQKDYFHSKENPLCAQCHKLEPTEYDLKPVSPTTFKAENIEKEKVLAATSTCYSCHKGMTATKYVHGPAALWSCLSCHNAGAKPRYAVKKPDTEMCFNCHTEQKKEWSSRKYTHGPVTIGKCAICHSPHASDNPFNLVKPGWNLCTTCHFEKGTGLHVLGNSMFSKGHPTHNRPDPLRKGKELTCASCHDPHTSNYPHLWAFEVQTTIDLCQKCHKKQ